MVHINPHFYIRISLILSLFFILACKKDWYNIKSDKNLTAISTLNDAELLLNNSEVVTTKTPGLGEIAADGFHAKQFVWDLLIQENIPIYVTNRNAYTWSGSLKYENVNDWNMGYQSILYCNIVLESLKNISPGPTETARYNEIKGNALFIKAKTLYELAILYCPSYIQNEESIYGLILKDKADVTDRPDRSNVKETFSNILNAIHEAKNLLPLNATKLTRASKLACWAMLSRVYLYMGQYDNSLKYSDSVLKNKSTLLDFNFIPQPNLNLGLFNNEVIFHSSLIYHILANQGFSRADSSLYDAYDQNDLRKNLYFFQLDDEFAFKGSYNSNALPFSGLATDEVYLSHAECLARKGKIPEAMQYLNLLLRSRYVIKDGQSTYIDKTATTVDIALTIILEERRKELVRRGMRWADLKRLNNDIRFQTTIERKIGGQTYVLKPNEYKYTFPIPQDEANKYVSFLQNPGW